MKVRLRTLPICYGQGSFFAKMQRMHGDAKTVLVFGAFDGLHDGHEFFLRAARKLGKRLVVSVAQDSVMEELKGRPPRKPLAARLADLRASGLVDETAPGDATLGSWSAVKKYTPSTIALGYDQTELEKELRAYLKGENLPVLLVRIGVYQPRTHHSSLLP